MCLKLEQKFWIFAKNKMIDTKNHRKYFAINYLYKSYILIHIKYILN